MPENFADVFVKAVAVSIDGLAYGDTTARILVALSGGPDSTALLLAANLLAEKSGQIILEAAHVNHRLRGKDSEQDEEFCRALCASLKIPLMVHQDNSATSTSSEDALRDRRYVFLQNEASAGHFHAVMTAHTANDQAETLLFRLIRGTSLKGLGGIKAVRMLTRNLLLLRPILSLSRDDVMVFLSEQKVTAREDLSNSQLHYSRNFIRRMILKPIEERFAGASERIADFAMKAAADNEFIEQQAQVSFVQLRLLGDRWDLTEIRGLHRSLFTRLLVIGLQRREIEVDSARIEALRTMLFAETGSRISLDRTWDAVVDGNHMQWLNKLEVDASVKLQDFEVAVEMPGLTPIPGTGRGLEIKALDISSHQQTQSYPTADALEALVDLSQFQTDSMGSVTIRRRRAGDVIQPLGMTQLVRLKKYLHGKKASRLISNLDTNLESGYLVSHCIVLAAGKEILWVPGIGLSEQMKVKANSRPTHRLLIVDLAEETN